MFKVFLSALVVLFSGCLTPSIVWASSPPTITLSPAIEQLILQPQADQASYVLTLKNTTDVPIAVNLAAVNFDALAGTGLLSFLGASASQLNSRYAVADWLTIKPASLSLTSGATGQATIIVNNRSSLTPGGHYGAVTATIESPSSSGQIRVHQVLSSLLFVTKRGGETYKLSLGKTTTTESWLGLPSQVQITFANQGNIHLTPHGLVTINDPVGRQISKGTFNLESGIVLPGASRQFQADLTPLHLPLWPGQYIEQVGYHYSDAPFIVTNYHLFYPGIVLPIAALIILTVGWFIYWRLASKSRTGRRAVFSRADLD